jgi:sugar phosphate isomerase/epimerase
MNLERGGDRPRLGLNMHPRWVGDGTPGAFLVPLQELGLSVLEFGLNLTSPDWPEMHVLIEACHQLGFQLSFHAPFKGPYNPAGFCGPKRGELEALYAPAMRYAARCAEERGPVSLVVHGAKGSRPREALRRDTVAFLTWILQEWPDVCPSLELLYRDGDVVKIGDNKPELVELVSDLGLSEAGICWDLGHDARNGSKPVPPGFLAWVRHVHVHDISPAGEDHCPLIFGNVPYAYHLRCLGQVGYGGAIILEVNGDHVCDLAAVRGAQPVRLLEDSFRQLTRTLFARPRPTLGWHTVP